MWADDERCEGVIQHAWVNEVFDNVVLNCLSKLDRCMSALQQWNVKEFGHIHKGISHCKAKLRDATNAKARKGLFQELRQWRCKEEILWWERSRTEFLRFGDSNSTWFHKQANVRRATNTISELRGADGVLYSEVADLERIVVDFFHSLFSSTNQHPFCDRGYPLHGHSSDECYAYASVG